MSYSLLNATALGLDLARRPYGSTAAAIRLTALTATTNQLATIAATASGASSAHDVVTTHDPAPATVTALLHRTTFGNADALIRLVYRDVLGPGSPAAGLSELTRTQAALAIADPLIQAWHTPASGPAARAPSWVNALPADIDLGPDTQATYRFLHQVAATDPADRDRWLPHIDHSGTPVKAADVSWLDAAHQASWAVHLSGRTHAHAVTQLLTVQAFHTGGFTPTHIGAWTEVCGTALAILTSDLLPTTSHHRLTHAYRQLHPRTAPAGHR